jgi:hypothetical protein
LGEGSGRQWTMRAAHGRQEQCRQVGRIVFRRIVLVPEVTQRFANHFTRVRVAS